MVAGFARYSVLNGAEIIRPKKKQPLGPFQGRKQGLLRQAGWRAWEDAAKKRRATENLFTS
jgi:hypothetical protein